MTYAPDAARRLRRVFVRGLDLQARLGVYDHEHETVQRVVIDLELLVEDPDAPHGVGHDRLPRVVDYAAMADHARAVALGGHTWLAETLAEKIALRLLRADPRIAAAAVTVAKPDALADAAAVGVTVERIRETP